MVGAAPSFSEIHVVRALFLINEGNIGRKKLVKLLEIGEGSARTLLKGLKEKGLIKSDKKGHELTKKGKLHLKKILEKFSKPCEIFSSIVEGKKGVVIVHNVAHKIDKGIEERDISLRAGADGAIILKYSNGIRTPVSDLKLTGSDLLNEIKKINLQNGDVIVVSFANTNASAENGALAIALNLTRK